MKSGEMKVGGLLLGTTYQIIFPGRRSTSLVIARGTYNRLIEDDRFPSGQILSEAQWRLNTTLASSGFSAYQMVFGSNPADLFGWDGSEEDIFFAQGARWQGSS